MIFVDAPGQSHDDSPGVLIPMGCAQTGERRDDVAAVGIGHLGRHVLRVGGGINEPHLVPQPLNRRPRHKNRAFQRVGDLSVQAPCNRRDQPVFAEHGLIPGVHQHKATGAVGVFGLSGLEAGLAEQRRLLVSRRPRDGDGRAKILRQRLAVNAAAGPDLREHTLGDVQLRENFIVPAKGVDVEQHGAGGVGIVRHMGFAAGELPDEPGLHGAEQQLAPLRPRPDARHILQNPAQLGAGKIGVDDQTGLAPEFLHQSFFLQLVAIRTGAAALPDDGAAHRLAGFSVPDDGGLPLVGDADGGNVGGGRPDVRHSPLGDLYLGRPDLVGVMLHPAGLGEILGKFLLGDGTHFPLLVKKNAAVGRGAGIQRHDVFCHLGFLLKAR